MKIGDEVAVPKKIEFVDRPLEAFNISDRLSFDKVSIVSDRVIEYLERYNEKIRQFLSEQGVQPRQFYNRMKRYEEGNKFPLKLWLYLNLPFSSKEQILPPYSKKAIDNRIDKIDEFLWFLGFYLAEGCLIHSKQDNQLLFSSNVKYLEKLIEIVENLFGIKEEIRFDPTGQRAPCVHVRSKIIVDLVINEFGFGQFLSPQKDIPNWIVQLPKDQLIHFLQGFWEGDGNHDAKTTGSMLIFNSSSQKIMEKLSLIVAKFGILGSISEFETRVRKGDTKRYKSYRLTIQGLNDYSLLNLARVRQTLQAKTTGDLAWAKVKKIEAFEIDDFVYDFSVPDLENFIGGTYGVCCHNTYGPRMLPNDGRVVSNFIVQALQGKALTVYGDGSQTRSFCYVSDLVEGFIRLMNSDRTEPVNIGNPGEYTILELAQTIQNMVNPEAELSFKPLPQDDPKQRQPDITRAREWLGWEPTVPLQEGLKLTIDYFRDRLAEEGKISQK